MTRAKTLLIILLSISILIIIKLIFPFIYNKNEGFDTLPQSQQEISEKHYQKFVKFYNPFIKRWQHAIQTYIATNQTQQPLSSPSQARQGQGQGQGQGQEDSIQNLNMAVQGISAQIRQPLPQFLNFTFPDNLPINNPGALLQISQLIPPDSKIFINAINWMNSHMSKSHGNLQQALQGNYIPKNEGFQVQATQQLQTTQQVQEQFISQQCSQQLQCDQEIQQEQEQQAHGLIQGNIQSFFSEPGFEEAQQLGDDLFNKSMNILNQAQNGDLYKQINIKDAYNYLSYIMPDGSDKLKNIQQNNPTRYNELQQKYPTWTNIKTLIDQINSTLV